ncbi:MAG: L,D-transpeptidase [Candidatus Zixiibacteriota bacterium]|nr:MAG: L,D-transpeptidase [candidate division Zixibacteria bacterium]
MAMKRLGLWLLLGLVALLTGAVAVGLLLHRQPPVQPLVAIADSALLSLPDDAAKAQKEIQRLRRSLTALTPKKPYIVIDTHASLAYLRTADSVWFKATCSTGNGGELVDSTTGRKWIFNTPHGCFKINSKITHPWWRKPDWAYIEEAEAIPKNESERYDSEMMGDYAMGFGNGYFIHGTIYERLLGMNVTHGCVRLGSSDLKWLFDRVQIGTPVYIF